MNPQSTTTLKTVARWLFGVLFIQLALGGFFSFFPAGIGFLVAGFVAIPPLCKWIEFKVIKRPLVSWQKYVAVIGGFFYSIIIMAIFVKPDEENVPMSQSSILKDSAVAKVDTIVIHDTIEIEKPAPSRQVVAPSQPVYSSPAPRQTESYSGGRIYYTGRRGGCYYINGNGNKVYVDRSYCQ